MSKSILQKTSFGLIRTNPKLTGNVKIIADSKDVLYLESFDATSELAKSKYKGFKVSSSTDYYFDLYKFFNQKFPTKTKDIYSLLEINDGLTIKNEYGYQYDTTYGYGAEPKISQLYPEQYSLLAPLWIEPSNVPDYFIICRTEDPVSVSTQGISTEDDITTIDLVENPDHFVKNILSKSKIIKSFDLTTNSNLGRYIRKHVNNALFPESAILADWNKGRYFKYNGISTNKPGFVSRTKELFADTWATDKTIIEYESIITTGFSELNVIHPNILNLEYLFDDTDTNDYEFYRYFGLYVNKAQYNEFFIDGESLFADRFLQPDQLPIPVQNIVGYKDNINDQIQTNTSGIVVYAETPPISSIGGTSFFPSEIVENMSRIGYLQDAIGEFHKIRNDFNFDAGTLKLDDTSINWKNFSGFNVPENFISSEFNDKVNGRPACVIEFVNTPIDDDEFRIYFTDPNDLSQLDYIDFFTMTATTSMTAGTFSSNAYSALGTFSDIAKAFAGAVNNSNNYYPDLLPLSAVNIGSKVIIFSRVASSTWNKVKVTSLSKATLVIDAGIKFISGQLTDYTSSLYQSSPQPFTPVIGWLATGSFVGGNDNPFAKVKISADDTELLSTDKYLVTSDGYSQIENIVPYIDEPVFDKTGAIINFDNFNDYYTINIVDTVEDILLTSSKQCSICTLKNNTCGLLSIYPFKDFDFDFYSLQYNKDADSNISQLYEWYLGATGPFGATSSFDTSSGPSGLTGPSGWIDSVVGPSCEFLVEGGFQNLAGIGNELADTDSIVYNEYDRLKENDVKQLTIPSRSVPFINKWVYDDDGLDVRQNPYRLNADASFRYPNFGPSFAEFSANPKFYTHEWYYLQKYPPYMTFEERKNSYSYFEKAINIGSTYAGSTGSTAYGLATVSGPTSIDTDYFTEYFTREMLGGTAITQEVKYNTFGYASNQRYAETLFRGAKVIVKQKVDTIAPNFNISRIKFNKGTKYNGYKFASIISLVENGLTLKVIENEKHKTITLVIEAGLMDEYFTKFGSGASGSTDPNDYFIDRTLMYTLRDKIELDPISTLYEPANKEISGAIYDWSQPGGWGTPYLVQGGQNTITGTWTNFASEFALNDDGGYNDIFLQHPTIPAYYLLFQGVSNPSIDTFECASINFYFNPYPTGPWAASGMIAPYMPMTDVSLKEPIKGAIPIYLNGGYRGYEGLIEDLSFANIAELINVGNPNVEYITYKNDGTIVYDDKVIELSRPTESYKANYLVPKEDTNIPPELESVSSSDVIGYQMSASERAVVNVMARYNGRYQPKFKDLFYFKDYETSAGTTGTRGYGFESYLNLEFNLDESNFGLVDNYFFNKVNPENPQGILRLNSGSSNPPKYPKINEVAITKRDLYSFMSNWDIDYYRKSLDAGTEESKIGYRGAKENKAFFGSKIMALPDKIILDNFDMIDIDDLDGGLVNINNVPESVVDTTIESQSTNASGALTSKEQIELNVFTTKALSKFLRADGIDAEFNTYINPLFSFGESGLDDDVENYIKENVYQRYVIKKIYFFESQFTNNVYTLDPVELGLTTFQLQQKGYKLSENVSVKFSTESPLNFTMIYNIPKLDNYSISFQVELEKK